MTRSMTVTRRTALLAGTAAAAAVVLSGCGTGQIAETANKEPSIYGVNTESPDNTVLVRGLAVIYDGVEGYPAGGSAPIEVALYNETRSPITVRITSAPATGAGANSLIASARRIVVTGAGPTAGASATGIPTDAEPSGSPEAAPPVAPSQSPGGVDQSTGPTDPPNAEQPTATPAPSGAPARPAQITIPPLSQVIFVPGGQQTLRAEGLSTALRSGMSLNLVFEFSNGGEPLVVPAPVGVPATPAPRATPENEGVEGGYGDDA